MLIFDLTVQIYKLFSNKTIILNIIRKLIMHLTDFLTLLVYINFAEKNATYSESHMNQRSFSILFEHNRMSVFDEH